MWWGGGEVSDQGSQHSADFIGLCECFLNVFVVQLEQFPANEELCCQFSAGTLCDIQKMDEFFDGLSLLSFRDIGGNGNNSATHLIS